MARLLSRRANNAQVYTQPIVIPALGFQATTHTIISVDIALTVTIISKTFRCKLPILPLAPY